MFKYQVELTFGNTFAKGILDKIDNCMQGSVSVNDSRRCFDLLFYLNPLDKSRALVQILDPLEKIHWMSNLDDNNMGLDLETDGRGIFEGMGSTFHPLLLKSGVFNRFYDLTYVHMYIEKMPFDSRNINLGFESSLTSYKTH